MINRRSLYRTIANDLIYIDSSALLNFRPLGRVALNFIASQDSDFFPQGLRLIVGLPAESDSRPSILYQRRRRLPALHDNVLKKKNYPKSLTWCKNIFIVARGNLDDNQFNLLNQKSEKSFQRFRINFLRAKSRLKDVFEKKNPFTMYSCYGLICTGGDLFCFF